MLIGIIGAGISGLVAGRELVKKGHDVIVIDKSRGVGGRMATRYFGNNHETKVDHGASYFTAKNEEFLKFVKELEDKGLVSEWSDQLSYHTNDNFYFNHPVRERQNYYCAPNGMNTIGKYLSRWMDFRLNDKVGGITMVAPSKNRKRPWVINFTSSEVLEVDALIIATPAVQAAGIIQLSQDETPIRSLFTKLEAVEYYPCFSIMAGYGDREVPEWKGIICQDSDIAWVSNENSKRNNPELTLVAHATPEFTRTMMNQSKEAVTSKLLSSLSEIVGSWGQNPYWSDVHFWRYSRPVKPINAPFLESSDQNAPLAVIGDYFDGSSVESAYLSGLKLAQHWSK